MRESEWIEGFIQKIESLKKDTSDGKLAYVPRMHAIPYNAGIPPEYKKKYISGEEIIPDESDNIYCFLIDQYKEITGDYPPINHGVNRNWHNYLVIKTEGWNPRKVEAFSRLFMKGTSVDESKRIHSLDELLNNESFLILSSRNKEGV